MSGYRHRYATRDPARNTRAPICWYILIQYLAYGAVCYRHQDAAISLSSFHHRINCKPDCERVVDLTFLSSACSFPKMKQQGPSVPAVA
jgi:hypothetical protein